MATSVDTSVVSVSSGWREATPVSAPRLLEALQRAATAEALPLPDEWPRIGRYQVCGRLGRGGMSTVWRARDDELGRPVALKLLRPDLPPGHGARLRREARALARLSHPNVVQVYEVMEHEGVTAVVMELIDGPTLRQWQERVPRPSWRACVEVYLQAGRGLGAAHAAGLVHRDFKPDNCIIDAEGRVRVLDFGLVVRAGDDETMDDAASESPESRETPLTRAGALLGTAAYMPPERLGRRVPVDGAAGDQFSFCASLYEAAYGERPFGSRSDLELVVAIVSGRVRPAPQGTRVPARLRRILLRGLATEPDRRWPSMDALLAELERLVAPPTRRWARGLATVSAATLVLAVGQAVRRGREPWACTGAEAQLRGVWDADQRQAVADAILGTGTQHARDTWARIEPALDEYAGRWAAKHTEVCEATRVTGAQTERDMGLRMGCLSGRRLALREVVAALRQPREATRARAIELVAGLPALSSCDDLEALQAQLPPPDPEQAAAVEAARERLSRARIQRDAGAPAAGEAEASWVVGVAERLGYEPLLAEALLERGEARAQLERPREAEADLERAYEVAVRIEHRRVETRAASVLARLLGREPKQLDHAERWGESALALAQRRGGDRLLLAEASSAMGYVRMMQGWLGNDATQREAATELHRRALVLYDDALGPRHPAIARELESVGDALMKHKQPEEAMERYERALAIYEASLGASHPAVAEVLGKLGEALAKQQEPEVALELYGQALTIQQAALGPWHRSLAYTWTQMGIALHQQGRLDEALPLHRHALEILRLAAERDGLAEIGVLSEIGFVLRDQGEMARAVEYYEESDALRDVVFGLSRVDAGAVLKRIGDELRERGFVEAAEERYRRSLARYEAVYGPRHHAGVAARVALAELALARGDVEAAVEYAERVAAIVEPETASSAARLAEARFGLARVLWSEPGQRGVARRLMELAREGYAKLGEGHEEALAEVEAWLDRGLER